MTFSPASLHECLAALPQPSGYLVAFSGGGDSTALLFALRDLRGSLPVPLRAAHVIHDLHPDAGRWADHCRAVCDGLGFEAAERRVRVRPCRGDSLESAARRARYRALGDCLRRDEMLLTAHTRDDQAETVLMRLLRGSGLEGLGGVPRCRRFRQGWLARPLLSWSRRQLREWLQGLDAAWLEDPDNANVERSRVFLRREVLPRLREHWPAADEVITRAGDNLAETGAALRELADARLARCLAPAGEGLRLSQLRGESAPLRRLLLRRWLGSLGLPEPHRRHLDELERQALEARDDAVPCVAWSGAEVHRYRDTLHAFAPSAGPDPGLDMAWSTDEPLRLPVDLGHLELAAAGSVPRWRLRVRFRRGGERIRLPGRDHHSELKDLLQAWGVPPWERGRLPLVFDGDELVSVADLQPSEDFTRRLQSHHATLRWFRNN